MSKDVKGQRMGQTQVCGEQIDGFHTSTEYCDTRLIQKAEILDTANGSF
jgi:hypothetical protein